MPNKKNNKLLNKKIEKYTQKTAHLLLYIIIIATHTVWIIRRINRNKAPFSPRDLYIFYMGLVYIPM